MKTHYHEGYCAPEELEVIEIETPVPGNDEVLVRVHAAGVNPLDWRVLRARPFLARLMGVGLFKPKARYRVPGADIAGVVEAVGKGVTRFTTGDEVFGDVSSGGFAEYVAAKEDVLARKPSNVTFEEAAAVPVAALTALQGLRNHGEIQAGQTVLINGASGGVGTYAVQLARALRAAEVTGICSTTNLDMVRSIGADHVIDYTKGELLQGGRQYDLILDCVGNLRISDYKRALTPKGRGIVIGFYTAGRMIGVLMGAPFVSSRNGRKIANFTAQANSEDTELLADFMQSGKLRSVIDRTYSFDDVPEAISYNEQGHPRGKVVIKIV